eukprot:4340129-Amphidinium_carterae.1
MPWTRLAPPYLNSGLATQWEELYPAYHVAHRVIVLFTLRIKSHLSDCGPSAERLVVCPLGLSTGWSIPLSAIGFGLSRHCSPVSLLVVLKYALGS